MCVRAWEVVASETEPPRVESNSVWIPSDWIEGPGLMRGRCGSRPRRLGCEMCCESEARRTDKSLVRISLVVTNDVMGKSEEVLIPLESGGRTNRITSGCCIIRGVEYLTPARMPHVKMFGSHSDKYLNMGTVWSGKRPVCSHNDTNCSKLYKVR